MKTVGIICATGALLVASAPYNPSYAQSAKPRYEVRRVAVPIEIDGTVSDEEWSAASPAVEFIFPWDEQTGAKQKTRARLLWDDDNLYVAYECDDADIVAKFTERDSWVYRDDTVEIFLNVRPSQIVAYYGLEINVRGAMMDYFCANAEFFIKRFQMDGVQHGIHVDGTINQRDDTDRGWSLELAVPWSNFSDMLRAPRSGAIFTATLNRWDGVEPERRLSVWVDSKLDWPHPHAPAEFGELVLVE